KPQPDIFVQFLPDPGKSTNGPRSTATTDAQGRYRLKTDQGQDGAVVGWHRVVLSDTKAVQASQEQLAAGKTGSSRVAGTYSAANTTPLRFEVSPGKNDIPLDFTNR